MNPWVDFFVTVAVRFVCGFVIGCIASFVLGFRTVLSAISESDFPVERFLVWGAVGGIVCIFTTPRDDWPWTRC